MGGVIQSARYQPAEVIRWLDPTSGRSIKPTGSEASESGWSSKLRQAADTVRDLGRSAAAKLAFRQAQSTEYVLYEDRFEARHLASSKTVFYRDVRSIGIGKNDRVVLEHAGGSLTIRPPAHLVAGRARMPIGWSRNGLEVPYWTLIEELAARCGVEIESL